MRSDTQGQGQGLTKVKRLDNIDNKIIEELDTGQPANIVLALIRNQVCIGEIKYTFFE